MSDKIDQALEYFAKGFRAGVGQKASGGTAATDREAANSPELFAHWKAGKKAAEDSLQTMKAEYAQHLHAEAGWPLSEAQVKDGQTHRHCDDYIHDHKQPLCLRIWLLRQRVPAGDGMLMEQAGIKPQLFATYQAEKTKTHGRMRVRVTMASRFGDVGITTNLQAGGYAMRVPVEMLSDFGEKP